MNFQSFSKFNSCILHLVKRKRINCILYTNYKSLRSISSIFSSFNTKWSFTQDKYLFKRMACCGSKGCGTEFSKEALKKKLTSIQYQVTQECDTERAFSGKYCNHFEKGVYTCVVCNKELFSSEAKYESKCGWPAFSDVVDNQNIRLKNDLSHDLKRTEVSCSSCGAHLGHVFDDGPKPTGKRYCINSAALDFRKAEVPESS